MLKDYNNIDELDKEKLVSDMDFIEDASLFLADRNNQTGAMTPTEVYESFMEHMRYQDMNEITALRDLEYAQNADLDTKQRFGRLIDAYDKVNEDVSGRMLWDYGEAILTAPSTYLGLFTGGTGKAAAIAGTQAAKLGVRKVLSGALKASAVEGAIGAGQGAMQEATRVETGIQEEFTGERTAVQGLSQATLGGLINLPVSALNVRAANKASERYNLAKIEDGKRASKASKKTKEVLAKANKNTLKRVKTSLDALDVDKVAEGRRLRKNMQPSETLEGAIGSDTVRNIEAAAVRVVDKLKLKKNERITSGLHRMIAEDKLGEIDEVSRILDEHNLTMDQFSLVFLAEVSEAGKILGSMSRLEKVRGKAARTEVGRLLDEMDKMNQSRVSGISGEEAENLLATRKVSSYVKDLDRMRLGLMTSQPATTARNNMNAGFRIGVDAVIRAADNALNLRNPMDGTLDVAKYTINQYESRVIEKLYRDAMPEEAAKLFREAADITTRAGSETVLGTIGRKANFLNTASDNFFKRAVFSAALKRRLSDKGIDLNEVITKGEFARIPDEVFEKATQDAYEFTYQASMRGDDWFSKGARGVIKAHQEVPFVISAFLPFPRFIANQLKFIYETMPGFGLMPLDRLGSKLPARTFGEYMKDKLPKQMAGGAMLGAAYAWREKQGDSAYWYEYKDSAGNYVDGRPVYGPFAPYLLMADYIYRYQNGTLPSSISRYALDTTQALLGSTFRTGTGLYLVDKFYQDIADGRGEKAIAETLGNVINSFTLPVNVARDIYGQFDIKGRTIPETRTGERKPDEEMVNFFDVIYQRATRSFPPNPLTGYNKQDLVVPTQEEVVRYLNPLEKQLFGTSKREKNPMLEEMGRLNLYPTDLYRRPNNDTLDLYMRQEMSREGGLVNLSKHMEKFISGKDYKQLPFERRLIEFRAEASKVIAQAKKVAEARIAREGATKGLPYSELQIQKYVDAPRDIKRAVTAEYKRLTGKDNILDNRNDTIEIDGVDVNVLVWAVTRINDYASKNARL